VSCTIVLPECASVPHDMDDFARHLASDEWNHQIYSRILRRYTAVNCREKKTEPVATTPHTKRADTKRIIRHRIAHLLTSLFRSVSRDSDAVLLTTYLPLWEQFRIQLKLRQCPSFWVTPTLATDTVNAAQRPWTIRGEASSEFELCAREFIPWQ